MGRIQNVIDPPKFSPSEEEIENSKLPECVKQVLRKVTQNRVYDIVIPTPCDEAFFLSESTNNFIWVKREDLHPIFSFKLRGAYNKISQLSESQLENGLTACSAGNHAQGIAFSAKIISTSTKIFMPVITPELKISNVRRFGGQVILVGNTFDETMAHCLNCAATENRTLIHAFNDYDVIAGQATVGLEILAQTQADPPDAIFVGCGGGGLMSGIGSVVKFLHPEIRIIGVEAQDAAGMTDSLEAGKLVTLDKLGTFADGAAVRCVGSICFEICQNVCDEMITVTTDEICAAIKDIFTDFRTIVEPAGALAIAGAKRYIKERNLTNKNFVTITSGANMDFSRLRFVAERCDTAERFMLVTFPEKPGAIRGVYDMIFPRDVLEMCYRMRAAMECDHPFGNLMLTYSSFSDEDVKRVEGRMSEAGYTVYPLQDNEMARLHGLYVIGGTTDPTKCEVLYRFECPSAPGVLKRFLYLLGNWNVTLMHYRNHGSDICSILLGIEVPTNQRQEFEHLLNKFTFEDFTYHNETENDFYRLFLDAPPNSGCRRFH